ncbi:MAG: HAMP domain-containing protein [Anaerolineales bacterium]|nr:MAG: HAMP domain-containing protein [Anaerolineales bacterium]
MRSLSLKLILAFLAVVMVAVALVAVIASQTTAKEFADFIFDQYQEGYISQLEEYYRNHGEWAGVDAEVSFPGRIPLDGHIPAARERGGITITDETGRVIIAGSGYQIGDTVSQAEFADADPIAVDGQTVGWILSLRMEFGRGPSEALFLSRINQTLILSAFGALFVALLLGIFLARTLTRPLRELTAATRAVAEGDLGLTVPVRSRDELGELTASFNRMSEELDRSTSIRRQMTADIAHELRTPISIILGHADAVHDRVLPPTQETFDIIRDEACRLERLVEDLRTLSMADAGELTLTRRPIPPHTLLEEVAAAYHPLALEKGIKVRTEIASDLPEVNVDPDRMAQVLGNLLSNALRFTLKGGSVTLAASHLEHEVEIRIQDTGPGIGAEDIQHVFDRFYRADKSRQRDSGGSGLGLAIAKSIVENHGGRIWAESPDDSGTTFVIMLPIANRNDHDDELSN